MSKVLVAIPAGDGYVHARLVQNLLPQLKGHQFLIVSGVSPVANARNKIVDAFMGGDFTHLWMVDADTIPPVDALERLLEVSNDYPIASGITPILTENEITSNVWLDDKGPMDIDAAKNEKGVFSALAVGTSCMLIRREVIEQMKQPRFAQIWLPDGNDYVSEDIYFCNVAEDLGFKIGVDPRVVCKHVRDVLI